MSFLAVAGSTYTFTLSVEDQSNAGLWKANPTIAAGDFQISVNAGSFSNLDNLPTVAPAGGRLIKIIVSAAETTAAGDGGFLTITGVDAAGSEWYDVKAEVRVVSADLSALVNAAVDTALADIDLDHLIQVTAGSEEPTDGSYLDQIMHKNSSQTFDAATDSLEALRDLLSVTPASSSSSTTITIRRGDSMSEAVTGLGDISARTRLYFTVKDNREDADTAAIIQIEETDGLKYLNGAAGTAGNGDITIDDAALGNITITLEASETDDLKTQGGLYYDIQMVTASAVTTLQSGTCNIVADVTRAVA